MDKRLSDLEEQIEYLRDQLAQTKKMLNDVIWEIHKIKLGIEDDS